MLKMFSKLAKAMLPLFTDTNSVGERKISIGRAPLFIILVTMCFHYLTKGVGPDTGVIAYLGMAMSYNSFSKTALNKADGVGKENDTLKNTVDEGH
jgi:hypothetical protein